MTNWGPAEADHDPTEEPVADLVTSPTGDELEWDATDEQPSAPGAPGAPADEDDDDDAVAVEPVGDEPESMATTEAPAEAHPMAEGDGSDGEVDPAAGADDAPHGLGATAADAAGEMDEDADAITVVGGTPGEIVEEVDAVTVGADAANAVGEMDEDADAIIVVGGAPGEIVEEGVPSADGADEPEPVANTEALGEAGSGGTADGVEPMAPVPPPTTDPDLPTMADLDALSAELDAVDATLVALDARSPSGDLDTDAGSAPDGGADIDHEVAVQPEPAG
ncbi:MAG: hypothetical protein AAF962_19045 [Actinomycetota bacterium]